MLFGFVFEKNEGNPIHEPVNPNISTFNSPAIKPPTAPPILAIQNTRPYFKLIPYIAGSVTPAKPDKAPANAKLLIFVIFDFAQTASAPAPCAIIVKLINPFKTEWPVCAISFEISGIIIQCKPKMTRT